MTPPPASSSTTSARGPLAGLRIVEFEGLGPGPLCGMILADFGAEVTVIGRPTKSAMQAKLGGSGGVGHNLLNRGKRTLGVNLKDLAGVELALHLVAQADALIEGNRPGVMERLGLGPEACRARNPRLVYGRMTGWGQDGPLAQAAGHDINYVALAGVIPPTRHPGQAPTVPTTIVGDAPAGLSLAFGIVCAIFAARQSGQGQVVDAAITDSAAYLGSLLHWFRAAGQLGSPDTPRLLQGDAPFYDLYECADGGWISLGPLEPQFFRHFLERLELTDVDLASQYDTATWPALKARVAERVRTLPRDEWCRRLEGTDVCFAPLLDLDEAARHPHHAARGTYRTVDGVLQAAPSPRLSGGVPGALAAEQRADVEATLAALGYDATQTAALRAAGVVG